jgi:multicomponent Na+:H+ antiporter subunit C
MNGLDFGHINYWAIIALFLLGLYGILASTNLMRKLMAMNILQVAVIYFFIALAVKVPGTIPILRATHDETTVYANPLPHALMLTAIVVGVATTGVALALLIRIRRRFGSLDEDEVLQRMKE